MALPDRYIGDDFYCDVAIPHAAELDVRRLLAVVQHLARQVTERDGAAAGLTNLGHYQDSKHLRVHVHSGPQRSRG